MGNKTKLKVLAGAIVMALSANAFAATTTADANGTIFLTIQDATTGSGYIFDTGLSVLSFTGTSNYSQQLNVSDPNYVSFQSSITNAGPIPDTLTWSVVGAATSTTSPVLTVLSVGDTDPVVISHAATSTAQVQVATLLANASNPTGGTSFQTAASALSWNASGDESTFAGRVQENEGGTFGTALNFYKFTSTLPSGNQVAGDVSSTFAGMWNLTASGLLSYNTLATPLPAPLLLLLSGLGLMGIVARRGQSSAMNGAAA